jgi:hypothetical protein
MGCSDENTDDEDDEDADQFRTPEAARDYYRECGKVFACPFNKNEPSYYKTSIQHKEKYMTCAAGLGWNISGLK